jgi:hypothetical protein
VTGPDALILTIENAASWSPTRLAGRYLDLVPRLGAGVPASFHVGTTVDTDDAEAFLGALASAPPDQQAWTIETESGANLTAYLEERWIVQGRPQPQHDEGAWSAWLRGSYEVVRAMTTAGELAAATLARQPTRAFSCIPAPPIARWNHVVAIPEQWATDAYGTDDLWRHWDTAETFGGLRLAARALDSLGDEAWAREVLPSQMALARAARPGATTWPARACDEWDPVLIARPDHGLETVGYLPDEQALELAGHFEPHEHVALRDILTVRALLESGQTSTGHPLHSVRVVFEDPATATRERVPLLDAGAEVWYVDRDGERRRVDA